jgi:hypothetical protein
MDWQQQVSKQEEEQQRQEKKKPITFTNDESLQRRIDGGGEGRSCK